MRSPTVIRASLEAIDRRCAEREAAWVDPTAAPHEGLGDLYLVRDRLRAELAALESEAA